MTDVQTRTIKCPKCGKIQGPSEICIGCGLLFRKYMEVQRKKQAELQAAEQKRAIEEARIKEAAAQQRAMKEAQIKEKETHALEGEGFRQAVREIAPTHSPELSGEPSTRLKETLLWNLTKDFFSFRILVLPLIIKVIYLFGVVLIILSSGFQFFSGLTMFAGKTVGSGLIGSISVFTGFITLTVGNIFWRFLCEIMLTPFTLIDHLKEIKEAIEKDDQGT